MKKPIDLEALKFRIDHGDITLGDRDTLELIAEVEALREVVVKAAAVIECLKGEIEDMRERLVKADRIFSLFFDGYPDEAWILLAAYMSEYSLEEPVDLI